MDWITLQNQVQLWQLYLKGLQKLNQLWAELLSQSLENTSREVAGDRPAYSDVTLYWEIYEKRLGANSKLNNSVIFKNITADPPVRNANEKY